MKRLLRKYARRKVEAFAREAGGALTGRQVRIAFRFFVLAGEMRARREGARHA